MPWAHRCAHAGRMEQSRAQATKFCHDLKAELAGADAPTNGRYHTNLPDWISAPPDHAEDRSVTGEPPSSTFLTTADVARVLQVSTRTVRRLIASGRIGALRIGRAVRIPQAAIDRLILGENLAIHDTSGERRE